MANIFSLKKYLSDLSIDAPRKMALAKVKNVLTLCFELEKDNARKVVCTVSLPILISTVIGNLKIEMALCPHRLKNILSKKTSLIRIREKFKPLLGYFSTS